MAGLKIIEASCNGGEHDSCFLAGAHYINPGAMILFNYIWRTRVGCFSFQLLSGFHLFYSTTILAVQFNMRLQVA